MASQSKTPKQPGKSPGKSKDSTEISSADDHLADGELSKEDLEKIAGGRTLTSGHYNTARRR